MLFCDVFTMEREILLEKLVKGALEMSVSRRALPRVLAGLMFTGKSYLELSPHELKLFNYNIEFREWVEPRFLANQQLISSLRRGGVMGRLDILRMYYPIYRAARDKFSVPWYLLWLIHDQESTCSLNSEAFEGWPNPNYGAMQRAIAFHPQSAVEEAAEGYEFLANLPQEHPADDWKEILWAASKLDRDAKAWEKIIPSKDRAFYLTRALYSYSAEGPASAREEIFNVLRRIFK